MRLLSGLGSGYHKAKVIGLFDALYDLWSNRCESG